MPQHSTSIKSVPVTERERLSRERIELAALALIEDVGLEGFSTRKLGAVLGCEAMSIYHHFSSKAHVIDALVDRVVSEAPVPPRDMDGMERLRIIAHGWRTTAKRYPRFFPVLSVHRLNSEVGVTYLNEILLALRDLGMDRVRAARMFRVVAYFLMGAALDEIAGYANGPSSLNPISDEVLQDRFPYIADAGEFFSANQFDATFEFGLNLLFDGIATKAR